MQDLGGGDPLLRQKTSELSRLRAKTPEAIYLERLSNLERKLDRFEVRSEEIERSAYEEDDDDASTEPFHSVYAVTPSPPNTRDAQAQSPPHIACETARTTPVGLVNLGNTCYMNSVLQALAVTTEFCQDILLLPPIVEMVEMRKLMSLMVSTTEPAVRPGFFFRAYKPTSFQVGVQQDSAEYLLFLYV